MKIEAFIFLLVLFVMGCKTSKQEIVNQKPGKSLPPNCVLIADNFYADKTEISNIDYKEYQYWVLRVFGENSEEYLKTKLDTTVWHKEEGLAKLAKTYHQDYFFNYYPVVGMTLEQAKSYTKWRTDRVAEMTLINNNLIAINPNQTPENCFTLERFLEGAIEMNKGGTDSVDDSLTIGFAEYRIPSSDEWELLSGLDSNDIQASYSLTEYNQAVLKKLNYLFNTKEFHESKKNKTFVTKSINGKEMITSPVGLFAHNKYGLFGVVGNVSEIVDEEDVSKGGNWKTPLDEISKEKKNMFNEVNCWTGFRNVCSIRMEKISISSK